MSSLSRLVELFNRANEAKLATGVGYLRQLREFYPLTRAPNFLGPSEYFDYRLYEPSLTSAAKRQFVGYRSERIYSRLNTSSWHGAANDKVLFEQVMIAAGFKTPKTLAIYHPWRVAGEYCEHVRTREDLKRFLVKIETYPVFVKPVHGLFGRGASLITGYEPETELILTRGHDRISVDEFLSWLERDSRVGMLFQAMLKPSTAVEQVCAERLSSVRMIVLTGDDGPKLFRANWKLCTGTNIMDNTEGWTNGNIVAAVDHTSGIVLGAYRGVDGRQLSIDQHPDTQVPLLGLKVPNWDAMKEYVESAARVFPGLRFQAWDIADTTSGVCAIEVNLATFHTVHATQLVSRQGFLDARLTKELAALE